MSRRTAKRQSFYAACRLKRGLQLISEIIGRTLPGQHTVMLDLAVYGMAWRQGGQRIDPCSVYIDALSPLWPPQVAIAVSAP